MTRHAPPPPPHQGVAGINIRTVAGWTRPCGSGKADWAGRALACSPLQQELGRTECVLRAVAWLTSPVILLGCTLSQGRPGQKECVL